MVVLAEDDHARSDPGGRLDDRPSGLTRRPGQLGVVPGGGEDVARLREVLDDVGRRRQLRSLSIGDVVEGAEVPRASGLSGMFTTLRTMMRPRDSRASEIARSSARRAPSDPS